MEILSPIQVEKKYQAPVEKVWEIITTQKYLSQWLMPGNFKAEVGHRYEFLCSPPEGEENWDGKVYGVVLEVNSPNSISFTWCNSRLKQDTLVRFILTETESGVLFKVLHEGFGKEDSHEYELHDMGWLHHLAQIESAL
ncbi:MAG: SRPBCC family protein [Salibacteraceae bacterium]